MPDQRDEIERHTRLFQRLTVAVKTVEHFFRLGLTQKAREMLAQHLRGAGSRRIERETAIADDQRGDALQRLFRPIRLSQTDQVVVAMRIDEARREIASARLD